MALLQNKVALITGAASGIGAAAVRIFAREGAKLIIADINEAPLKALAEELGADSIMTATLDVADQAATQAVVDAGVARFGGLDIAVLNVGVAGHMGPLSSLSVESFESTMRTNVTGAFVGVKVTMPEIAKRGGGSIVITASTAGFRSGAPGRYGYVTSKHAVVGLMRAAAAEGAQFGVRVNSVSPGGVDTPMSASLKDIIGEEQAKIALAAFERTIPLKRMAQPDEIADTMLFFASDLSRYCTATNLMVDGGLMG
jgi:NAD(P)-dependent dehydrogenase (short-subunit alcohol dehydrogenase family)